MVKSTPLERKLLSVVLGLLLTVVTLALVLPSLLVAWPPQFLERRSQREKVRARVELAGGWDAIRRACADLAEQHTDGFHSQWRDTNLPPAVLALKPLLVDYAPQYGRVSMRVFGIHSTGGHSVPYFGLEVVTASKASDYRPGVGYGGGVIGNYHSACDQVAEGIYEVY